MAKFEVSLKKSHHLKDTENYSDTVINLRILHKKFAFEIFGKFIDS